MNVKDLRVEEFKLLIREAVEEELEEVPGDPDSRLELREEVKKRLVFPWLLCKAVMKELTLIR